MVLCFKIILISKYITNLSYPKSNYVFLKLYGYFSYSVGDNPELLIHVHSKTFTNSPILLLLPFFCICLFILNGSYPGLFNDITESPSTVVKSKSITLPFVSRPSKVIPELPTDLELLNFYSYYYKTFILSRPRFKVITFLLFK